MSNLEKKALWAIGVVFALVWIGIAIYLHSHHIVHP